MRFLHIYLVDNLLFWDDWYTFFAYISPVRLQIRFLYLFIYLNKHGDTLYAE